MFTTSEALVFRYYQTRRSKDLNSSIIMINQIDEEDKSTVFKIIDTMLTKKKFKDFFKKNVAAL